MNKSHHYNPFIYFEEGGDAKRVDSDIPYNYEVLSLFERLDVYPKVLWKKKDEHNLSLFWGNETQSKTSYEVVLNDFFAENNLKIRPKAALVNGEFKGDFKSDIGKTGQEERSLEEVLNQEKKNFKTSSPTLNFTPDRWEKLINEIKTQIETTTLEKLVISRSVSFNVTGSFPLFTALTETFDVSSYFFLIQLSETEVYLSCSPESLFRLEPPYITSEAIAGTAKKGQASGEMLLKSSKDLKEHYYVVEHLKEVFSDLFDGHTYDSDPQLIQLKNNQHLITNFSGYISDVHFDLDYEVTKLIKALHPTPALGSYPRNYAKELLSKLEEEDRGFYGAPIGVIDHQDKTAEVFIGIRSLHLRNDELKLQAGCGIVSDSIASSEWNETEIKLKNYDWLKKFSG